MHISQQKLIALSVASLLSHTSLHSVGRPKKPQRPQQVLQASFNSHDAAKILGQSKKYWCTVAVYMAADNDLYPFAERNIQQMMQVGSNENLAIVAHLDIRRPGKEKTTRRYLIGKHKTTQLEPTGCMDSGDEATFTQFMRFVHEHFPSEHLVIIFWNHGSGALNPVNNYWASINSSKLFHYNKDTNLIELDRSISFLDYVALEAQRQSDSLHRGICFDESTGHYLDDEKLMRALQGVCDARGKKIDALLFDACLMSGAETAWIAHQYADYMVASEEVELGTGYDYNLVLGKLATEQLEPARFAQHVVAAFEWMYGKLTNDYTHSALCLAQFGAVANNIDLLGYNLTEALKRQQKQSVQAAITASRNRQLCTHFDEPSYIDLHHFYRNLRKNLYKMELTTQEDTDFIRTILDKILTEGIELIEQCVIANSVGKNLHNARGISIYFPERRMHSSYPNTQFAHHNNWLKFLQTYLALHLPELPRVE